MERKLAGPGAPGKADRLVAKVERREALRPTLLGAHGWRYRPCGVKRLLRLRGVPLAHPGASRRSISLARFARNRQTSDALRRENAGSCPGRDAAFFTLLRRTGTHALTNAGALEWARAPQRTASRCGAGERRSPAMTHLKIDCEFPRKAGGKQEDPSLCFTQHERSS